MEPLNIADSDTRAIRTNRETRNLSIDPDWGIGGLRCAAACDHGGNDW
jgi:hypothetical protein